MKDKKNEPKRCTCKTEVYSRVVGYIRPIENWNDAKKEEFDERETYEVEKKKNGYNAN